MLKQTKWLALFDAIQLSHILDYI